MCEWGLSPLHIGLSPIAHFASDNKVEYMKKIKVLKNRIVARVIATGILVAGLAGFSGCGAVEEEEASTQEQAKLITVGFSQLGAESDWRVANTASIQNSLTRQNGFDLMFDDAQQKQDKQFLAIRNFTQQEVDCIVLAPVMETGWDTVLQEAKDAGIPVVVVDRQVKVTDTALVTAWVGSDFTKEGKIACEWLKSYTETKGIEPGDLNIVDIQGTLGATAQIGRTNGIVEASAKYGWNLVAQVPADYTQAKGKEVMANLLAEHPDINVVYAENDNEAIGAIEAIEEAGKKAGADISKGEILVISFDAAHSGLSQVLEGKIALDVECNPLQGEEVEKLIKAVKNGEEYNKYTYVKESAFSFDDTVKSVTINDESYDITPLTENILNSREY
ncbi:simple sugar transport system substrate-binding protein [Lachnospiraceae bacterium NE2001]|nr:simple sugar transport system substrate-binding protein [Lachnospiraceae bacterium NE2001]